MTNHPITPPPELVQDWMRVGNMDIAPLHLAQALATQAARWGWEQCMKLDSAWLETKLQKARDEELEACCEWLAQETPETYINALRAARRPKPPSLKEQALQAHGPEPLPEPSPYGDAILNAGAIERHRLVRRALEQLDD